MPVHSRMAARNTRAAALERSHLTDCIVSSKEDDQGTFAFIEKSQCAKVDPQSYVGSSF
jgi:hypothetical protein